MTFVIANTFIASLGRLTAQEQKTVKTTVFDLQVNPASPGLSFHKLDRAKDPNFLVRARERRYPTNCPSHGFEHSSRLRGSP